MIDHLSTYATDFPATRAFYEAALARLGYSVQFEMVLDSDPDGNNVEAVCHAPPA